jgi:signal transduction histidine kinase
MHKEVDELKGNFLSLISHNLKTPIAKIRAMSSVLLHKDSDNLREHQIEATTSILRSSRDLTSYISNILNITRIGAQKIKLHKNVCDINSLITQSVEKMNDLVDNKKIKFKLDLEPIFSVEVDKELIFQVLYNILENAIKYSPKNSTITISSKEEKNFLLISIKDQGIGISKEESIKIFQKFHRTNNIYTESITGTGLGLYLSKYFVNLHGGEIKVESALGDGSTFIISLPLE